ncbi:HET-domain-containing protein [Xylariaceae sp. AK1471]|nr:HET-domain-containing protein [Xylariaceae sp. AK1471]
MQQSVLYSDPLVPSKREIRLLELLSDQNRIICRLHKATLSDTLQFAALSYVWRDPKETTDIVVNGVAVPVTTQLAAALKRADLSERGKQVQFMPKIYASAELVLAWLRSEHLKKLAIAATTIMILSEAFREASWNLSNLIKLPELPYWNRAWILQENTLACNLFYISPYYMIEQRSLINVYAFISEISSELTKRRTPRPKFIPDNQYLLRFEIAKRLFLAKATTTTPNKSLKHDLVLSQLGGTLQATDPKDHIYGLLGLHSLQVKIDYSDAKQVKDVYINYCHAVIDVIQRIGSRDLFFLLDSGIGLFHNKFDFPSWAPNYPEKAQGEPSLSFEGENRLASLIVDIPHPKLNGPVLSVAGATLDVLQRLGGAPTLKNLRSGEVRAWCQDFLQRHPRYPTNTMPSLWALFLVVMRLQALELDTLTFLLLECFKGSLKFDIPNTKYTPFTIPQHTQTPILGGISVGIIENGSNNPDTVVFHSLDVGGDDPAKSVKERFFEVEYRLIYTLKRNYNARLFETDGGYLGLGPKYSAEGDIICIIDGYEDLVLLRECGSYYQYVGPCIVPGLPGENIKEDLTSGDTKVQIFNII